MTMKVGTFLTRNRAKETLGEAIKPAPRTVVKGKAQGQRFHPDGRQSGQCAKGRHIQCYSLRCSCDCHSANLKSHASDPRTT